MKTKLYWVKLSSQDIDRIRASLKYYRWFVGACEYWGCKSQWSNAELLYTITHMNHILSEKPIKKEVSA